MEHKKKTKEFKVRDYSGFTMDEIETEFTALEALGRTNLDIGATGVLRQALHIIGEQLELIEEIKKRKGLSEKELDKIFGPVKL